MIAMNCLHCNIYRDSVTSQEINVSYLSLLMLAGTWATQLFFQVRNIVNIFSISLYKLFYFSVLLNSFMVSK